MSWLILSVLSALFLGLYDVAKKASVDDNAVLVVLFACSLAGVALVAPASVLTLLLPQTAARWGVAITPLSWVAHGLIVLKAAIVTLSWVLTFFALKALPISLAGPVRASAPIFTLFGAVAFFGERPNTHQWLGILLTLAAYWAFSVIGRAEGIHFGRNRWVWMLFAGTLVGAVSGLYDKQLLQSAQLPPVTLQFWFTAYNAVLQGLIVGVFWWPSRKRHAPFQWRWSILAVGALLLLADALYFRALAMPGALVSVVATLRRTNVVISFAVGGLAFHERFRRRKAIALLGVLAGLFLLLK
jgi:drug/metabolite transporter (DMT)-like permease